MHSRGGKKSNKRGLWLLIIVLLTAAAATYLLAIRSKDSTDFAVTDDAYVASDAPAASTNNKILEVSNAEALCSTTDGCANSSKYIYLKFKIGNFPQQKLVETINLELSVTNLSGDGGQIYLADNNKWTEQTLTWNNAPSANERPIGSIGPVLKYGSRQVPLPPSVLKPNSELTLIIKSNDRNIAAYKSREAGDGPKLKVEFGDQKPVARSSKSVVILAGGDIACGGETQTVDDIDCKQLSTAQIIGSVKPEVVLALGDLQYENGELKDFEQHFNQSWGQFKPLIKPAVGNHEYNNSFNSVNQGCAVKIEHNPASYACGYFDYFDGQNKHDGQAGERGKGYYAFSRGNWRFYAVNSNCTIVDCQLGSAQERWLRDDLAKHLSMCKLMYMHHPIISSDVRNFDAYLRGLPDPTNFTFIKLNQSNLADIYRAFYDYGGDLVLAGHSHFYERFGPQNTDFKPDEKGFQEIVVGTGGRYTYNIDAKHLRPQSSAHSTMGTHGLLKLNLETNSYSATFMPAEDSDFTDQSAGTCHLNN